MKKIVSTYEDAVKTGSHGFKRIFALGEEKVTYINARLIEGMTTEALAKEIQNKWGYFKDVSLIALGKQLRRYRDTFIAIRKDSMGFTNVSKVAQDEAKVTLERMKQTIQVVDELEEVVLLQKNRVMKTYGAEQGMPAGILNHRLNNEIRLYVDALTRLSTLQMDLGILQRIDPQQDTHVHIELNMKEHDLFRSYSQNATLHGVTIEALEHLSASTTEVQFDSYN